MEKTQPSILPLLLSPLPLLDFHLLAVQSHHVHYNNNNSDYNFSVKGNIHDVTKITGTKMKHDKKYQIIINHSYLIISFSSMICFYALLLIYKAELDRVYASNNIYFFWACFYTTSTRINLLLKVNRKVFDNIR